MSMKPGATTSPLASMIRLAVAFGQKSQRSDLAALDRDVANKRWVSGAVGDSAVADEEVVVLGGRERTKGADANRSFIL